jgi:uncharacterized protein (UPF0147 family)
MVNGSLDAMKNIVFTLSEIKEDSSVPRNIRVRVDKAICCLGQEREVCLNVDEALQELEDVSNDPNLPIYTRIEILNIISSLEVFNSNGH